MIYREREKAAIPPNFYKQERWVDTLEKVKKDVRRPTRNDVAKLAGVSPAVVSFVLNDSNYVSDSKRKAVLNAIEQLNYYPNVMAQGLKKSKTSQIAIVCDNVVHNEWLYLIEKKLYEKGYYVTMCHCRPEDGFLQMILQRHYDGVFLMSGFFNAKQLNSFVEQGPPLVFYKTRPYDNLNSRIATVAPDYYEGIGKAVDYLALNGHERIALIPPARYPSAGLKGDDFRTAGYVAALEKHCLTIDEELICKNTETEESICQDVFYMLASNLKRPTALIVVNDYLASRMMKFVMKMGLRVPQDVSIIGADNSNVATVASPELTTIDFSKEDLANNVSNRLIDMIQGKDAFEDIFLPTRLIIRDSTCPVSALEGS